MYQEQQMLSARHIFACPLSATLRMHAMAESHCAGPPLKKTCMS